MIARRLRRIAVPLLVGAIGLGLSGCTNRSSDAAVVTFHDGAGDHSVNISRSEFEGELDTLLGNPLVAQVLSTNPAFQNLSSQMSTTQTLSSSWLTTLIRQTIFDAEVAESHITLSPADTDNALKAEQQTFSPAAFTAFPKPFQQKLLDREARLFAIFRYYQTCPSGRFVSHILLKTEAEATAALALIHDGRATFAELAKAQSTDTGSGKVGGALGCVTPGQFVKPFQDAADTAPLDVPTGPVKTRFGYHLILVRRWDPVGDRAYTQALSQAGGAVLSARLKDIHVWVNPRYGSWAPQTDAQGNTTSAVVPPVVPNPRVCREQAGCTPTSTTTTTAPAGG